MTGKARYVLIFSFILLALSNPVLAQSNASQSNSEPTYRAAFDDSTRLLNVTWTNSGVILVIESDIPRRIAITDPNSVESSGVSEPNVKRQTLNVGRTRIVMDLEQKQGSMSAWISVSDNILVVSNPTQPLFENITRRHFYLALIIAPITTGLQVFIRRWLGRYLLKRRLYRVA